MFTRSLRQSYRTLSLTTHTRSWTSLTRTQESITVHALNDATFPYIWLRDSCQAPESINPKTGHKLHCTSDIPLDIAPIEGDHGLKLTETALEISWTDGRKSVFEKHWLETYSSPSAEKKFHWEDSFAIQPWSRASILASDTFTGFPYETLLSSDEELLKAYEQVAKYGILFIRGVPTEETSDEKCELKRLAERFGEMRKTFYGLVWDVVKLKDGKNVAFTNLDLRLHMDLLFVTSLFYFYFLRLLNQYC
jgi:gamma-butyrobetaine dioxygenase